MVLLSLLLPTGTFWLVLAPVIRDRLMCGGLALALGLGSASAILVATMAMRGRLDSTLVVVDIILRTGLAAVAWWFAAPPPRSSVAHPLRPRIWTSVLLLLVATLSVIAVVRSYAAAPHGAWDAWAIWNLRARFLAPELTGRERSPPRSPGRILITP